MAQWKVVQRPLQFIKFCSWFKDDLQPSYWLAFCLVALHAFFLLLTSLYYQIKGEQLI